MCRLKVRMRYARRLQNAGAGKSKKYSHASFSARGIGRFKPLSGARPAIGTVGKLEEVEEEKIEVTCGKEILNEVLSAIRRAHPYEEPAIDRGRLRPHEIIKRNRGV